MKLWLILYVGKEMGGSWGPLPYDLAECEVRAADRRASIEKMISSGIGESGNVIPPDMIEKLKTWSVACERHADRPALGDTIRR